MDPHGKNSWRATPRYLAPFTRHLQSSYHSRNRQLHFANTQKLCLPRDWRLYHGSDAEFTVGPIVTQPMFINGRRQLISRNRGPYHHDSDYARALIELQIADVHFLKTMPSNDPNFDEDLIEDGPAILHAMEGMLSLIPTIFPETVKRMSRFAQLFYTQIFRSTTLWLTRIPQSYRNHRLGMHECESELARYLSTISNRTRGRRTTRSSRTWRHRPPTE
jgi:hypothetical protein